MAMRWYVIHAYSGFEKKVAQSIEEQARQLGMEDLIDQVMVPTEEVVEMRRGAKVTHRPQLTSDVDEALLRKIVHGRGGLDEVGHRRWKLQRKKKMD